jgi:hypothetical protein
VLGVSGDGASSEAANEPDPDVEVDDAADTEMVLEMGADSDETAGNPVANARRRHGTAGAILAAGMLGIDIVLGRKPKEEVPVVVDAPTEPTDIDADGIRLEVDATTTVVAPALPRTEPQRPSRRSRRRSPRSP